MYEAAELAADEYGRRACKAADGAVPAEQGTSTNTATLWRKSQHEHHAGGVERHCEGSEGKDRQRSVRQFDWDRQGVVDAIVFVDLGISSVEIVLFHTAGSF
ncbi:hypothetical protein ACS8E9_19060 [Pseudomonas neustonica]|uniref:hypothetical protein n=1 Tax=Pseudomonas neustonica TaxID=2487346 RepID=UPI003F45AC8F